MKKNRFIAVLLTALYASTAFAVPQKAPTKDEGTAIPRPIARLLKLPEGDGSCLVSLPDPQGNQARVARVAARMSAWVADQKPGAGDKSLRPIIYLHREGDKRVTLHGPAKDIMKVSNGQETGLDAKYAFIRNEEGKEHPMGLDRTNLVHWMPLDVSGTQLDRIENFKSGGPYTSGMFSIVKFTVPNDRLYPAKIGKRPKRHTGSYTVQVLMIKTLGQARTFGICM